MTETVTFMNFTMTSRAQTPVAGDLLLIQYDWLPRSQLSATAPWYAINNLYMRKYAIKHCDVFCKVSCR